MKLYTALRIVCGLYLLPHFILKVSRIRVLHNFYERAHLPFPTILAPIGFLVEGLVVISLLANIQVRYAAALGVLFMLVAAYATVRLNGIGKWRWEKGGPEYPLVLATLLALLVLFS